jgi:hypothetical protein
MTARVEINPNLRLDGDLTMVDLNEDVEGDLNGGLLELVQVYERESGLTGRGWVSRVDRQDGTLTVIVDWAGLSIPDESATVSGSVVHGRGVNRIAPSILSPDLVTQGQNLSAASLTG